MATSLAQGITSAYIGAANMLRPSGTLSEVYVYVEGLDDVAFWNRCLHPYFARFSFKITQLKKSEGVVAEGKRALLEAIGISSLGPNKLVAIDSDYDWIIEGYRTSPTSPSYSYDIRTNPYILHTYLYAIENYKCHPACVQEMVVKLTNSMPNFDIERYFGLFSSALSELFLIHLVSADLCDGTYPLKKFREDADKINFSLSPISVMPKSEKYIKERLKLLEPYAIGHKVEIEAYRAKLSSLAFTPETYFFLFQGHIVANILVKKHFQKAVTKLRSQRIAEINSEGTTTQQRQRISQFESITGIGTGLSCRELSKKINRRFDQLIYDCTDITRASIGYTRITGDLEKIFK